MFVRIQTILASILLCSALPGCFDAESMIESHRAIAIQARLEQVDLGTYQLTLPQPPQTTAVAKIHFHIFGRVANRHLKKVNDALEENGPQLRHELILSARQLQLHEIQDPELTALRTRILDVFNATLPNAPLQSVGFFSFRYLDF